MKKLFALFLVLVSVYDCSDGLINDREEAPDVNQPSSPSLSIENLREIGFIGIYVTLTSNTHGIIYGVIKPSAEPAPSKEEIKSDSLKEEFTVLEDDQEIPVDYLVTWDKLAHITEVTTYTIYFFLEKEGVGSSEIVSLEHTKKNNDLALSVGSLSEITPTGVNVTLTASTHGTIYGAVQSSAEPAPTKAKIKLNTLKTEFTVLDDDQGIPVYYLIPWYKLANITEAAGYTAYFFLERAGVGSSEIVSWEFAATNSDLISLGIVPMVVSVGSPPEISLTGANVTLTANLNGIIYGVVQSSAEPAPTKEEIKSDTLKVEFTVLEDVQEIPVRYLIPWYKLANITEAAGYTAYFFLEKAGVGSSEIVSWEFTATNSDLISLGIIPTVVSVGSPPEISLTGANVTLTANLNGILYGVVQSSAEPAPTKEEIKSDTLKVEFTVLEDVQEIPVRYLIPRYKLANITEAASYTVYFFLEKAGVGSSEMVSREFMVTINDLILLGTVIIDLSIGSSSKIISTGIHFTLTATTSGILYGVVQSSAEPAPTKEEIKSDTLKVEFTVLEDAQEIPAHYLIPQNKLANITEAAGYTAYFFLERAGVGSSEIVSWEFTATNSDLISLGIVPMVVSVESSPEISLTGANVTLTANFNGILYGVVQSSAEPAPTKEEIKSDTLKVEFTVVEDVQEIPVRYLIPRYKLANITEVASYTAYFFLEKAGVGSSDMVSREFMVTINDLILLGTVIIDLSIGSSSKIISTGIHVTLTATTLGIIYGVVQSSAEPAPTKEEIKSDTLKVEFTVLEDAQGVPTHYLIPPNKLANITEAAGYTAYFFLERAGVGSSEIVSWEFTATNSDLISLGIVPMVVSVGSSPEISLTGANVTLTANFNGIIYGVVQSSAEPVPTKEEIKSDTLKVEFTVVEDVQEIPVRYLIPQNKLANITEAASYTVYFFLEKAGVGSSDMVSREFMVTINDLILLRTVIIDLSIGSSSKIISTGIHVTLTATTPDIIYGVVQSSAEPAPTKEEIKSDTLKVEFTVLEDAQGVPAHYLIPRDKLANITEVASYTAYFFLERAGVGSSEIVDWEHTITNTDLVSLGITTIADLISSEHSTTEINAILKELASRESSVCSVSTEEAATHCLTVLPETVYDSSDRFIDRLPDQTDKYLIRIDTSRVFEATDDLTYEIVSGNPKHTARTLSGGQGILFNLSGYRITSDGKLYPKDVFLLGRNRSRYVTETNYRDTSLFDWPRGLSNYQIWNYYLAQCLVRDDGVLDCSDFYDYHVEHTFLRTDTDTLTIEVKNKSTNVTKTVVVNVYPTPRAFPAPAAPATPTLPASSDGVSCLSAKSKVIDNCTASLPLVAYDASPNFITGGNFERIPKQTNKYLIRVDASAAFPDATRLSYQILSGNPHYSISSEGRIVNLNGYFINPEGKVYTKDVWLLGRNKNVYDLEKDQLHGILFGPWLGFRGPFIEHSRCRPVFDSEDIDCSGLHSFRWNYTFGKSESDTLLIRVTNQDTSEARDIKVTINPHPDAVRLASECASADDLHEWGCINAAPLIPDREFTTTDAMRNALPSGLVLDKSKYELVAETKFDSFEEMGNMFHVPFWFRESDNIQITNGKLQMLIRPVPGSTSGKCGYSRFTPIRSTGVFEPGAGYIEYRVTKYPYIAATGGNVFMWSRYGINDRQFWLNPPSRVASSNERTSVSRTDLGRLGFAEIDFLERWGNFPNPFYVVHTYPLKGSDNVSGIPIKDSITRGLYFQDWGSGTSNNDASGANTYSITYGMEISPGRLNHGRTINFFKDGKLVKGRKYSNTSHISDYINSGAFRIDTISDIVIPERSCSTLRETMIEMDYIRYYRPKDGY